MNRHPTTRGRRGRGRPGLPRRRPGEPGAFTLIELLVVVSVIALVLAIALPSFSTLFSAGADQQARNMVGAMLSATRGVAIENQSYALLHIQLGVKYVDTADPSQKMLVPDDQCWMMLLQRDINPYDPAHGNDPNYPNPRYLQFIEHSGYPAQVVPGGMAFGEVSDTWVTAGGGFDPNAQQADPPGPTANFTTINVIFGPDGSLVEQVPDANGVLGNPTIDTTIDPALTNHVLGQQVLNGSAHSEHIWIWFSTDPNYPNDPNYANVKRRGVRTLAEFEYKLLKAGAGGAARAEYLERSATFVTVNPYSGQLLPTK